MRNLLLCVKDEDDPECALEGEVGSQLNGMCGQNGEGCVPPELAVRVERGGCVPTELAARAEYLAIPTNDGEIPTDLAVARTVNNNDRTDFALLGCSMEVPKSLSEMMVFVAEVTARAALAKAIGAPGDPRLDGR